MKKRGEEDGRISRSWHVSVPLGGLRLMGMIYVGYNVR